MKRQLAVLVFGLAAVLLACGQLAHAKLAPAPNDIEDSLPHWSADGLRVGFDRTAPSLQHIVTMTPSGTDTSIASSTGLFRGFLPGTPYLLVQLDDSTTLTVGGRYGGPAARVDGVDASASPDGSRIAYLRGATLYVGRLDSVEPNSYPTPVLTGSAIATAIAPPADDVVGPVWSRDGTRVVVASGSSLVVANADGSGTHVIANGGPNPTIDPTGTTIAYERSVGGLWQIWRVDVDGRDPHVLLSGATADYRFPTFSPVSGTIAFISDRQRVPGGATAYQYALYERYGSSPGVETKLVDDVHPSSPPAWSPTAESIAVAAGQECLRWGIAIAPAAGGHAVRRSNRCRYDGTAGADTIHGSPYFDIVNGLGGNDRLYGFWGNDKILGENGDDLVVGDAGNDVLFGGPGDDRISGGTGNDVIIPGNGHDWIDCGAGNDTVEGAGPLDHVAKNCEHVRR